MDGKHIYLNEIKADIHMGDHASCRMQAEKYPIKIFHRTKQHDAFVGHTHNNERGQAANFARVDQISHDGIQSFMPCGSPYALNHVPHATFHMLFHQTCFSINRITSFY